MPRGHVGKRARAASSKRAAATRRAPWSGVWLVCARPGVRIHERAPSATHVLHHTPEALRLGSQKQAPYGSKNDRELDVAVELDADWDSSSNPLTAGGAVRAGSGAMSGWSSGVDIRAGSMYAT